MSNIALEEKIRNLSADYIYQQGSRISAAAAHECHGGCRKRRNRPPL